MHLNRRNSIVIKKAFLHFCKLLLSLFQRLCCYCCYSHVRHFFTLCNAFLSFSFLLFCCTSLLLFPFLSFFTSLLFYLLLGVSDIVFFLTSICVDSHIVFSPFVYLFMWLLTRREWVKLAVPHLSIYIYTYTHIELGLLSCLNPRHFSTYTKSVFCQNNSNNYYNNKNKKKTVIESRITGS